jgi:hypothetical protein
MSLFTPIQISLLQDMASSRSQQLEMEALQPYADYLYDAIVEDLTRDKSLIFSDLMRATRDAANPEAITVPVWRFVSSFTPPEDPTDETRPDSYIGVSETSYSAWHRRDTTHWSLPPVAMQRLFCETDLLTRLSLVLGEQHFEVCTCPDSTAWNEDDDIRYNDVVIRFFPRGVGPEQLARIEAVKTKYNTSYTPRPLEEGEVVMRSGDACRPPRTPDFGPAAAAAPPRLPLKRPSTLIAESEDEDDGSDSPPVSPPCFCPSCMGDRDDRN